MDSKLNVLLADLTVESRKLRNFYWYAQKKQFFITEKRLEGLYVFVNGTVDKVAEAIAKVGGSPINTLKKSVDLSRIEESTGELQTSNEIYRVVLADFLYLLNTMIEVKKNTEEDIPDLVCELMDTYITELSKYIRIIRRALDAKKRFGAEGVSL